ncbi:MAG: type II toxin-antitoxin system VapC family toxin [Candidatus Dormibacteraeota bacterium]|uniref:Type II toxin-antitoxin system VapC family toxin n=1 Tax=Candidatus Dormiibacter inghamiae TaxID=3127013 RepID=A0A934KHI6_9BACT|nr:type II toxin-antitoxin system VapC family toxin [Candidatus Dormibacteraeota bacterium]MBJ7607332.1 type II toxin-antitoxin system VapC family toxin [Candidatus Dormibacteraeota bacterium]
MSTPTWTSALLKLCWPEPETVALENYLRGWPQLASAALIWTDALLAAHRHGPVRTVHVERRLLALPVLEITRALFQEAGALTDPGHRSLDAIHLAAAISLGADLGVVVTYDERMRSAAAGLGLSVAARD